ncbi:MAG: DUF624 domain-containing protein [Clostridiales bacterium]|nr:DUF624 domain-containing protein [Clostridiales bacterium]
MKDKKEETAEEKKGPVKRFIASVADNFTTLVGVNFLYAVFNIPMMLLAFVFVLVFLPMANPIFVPENFYAFMADAGVVSAEGTDGLGQLYYMITALCAMILMGTGLICVGPFQVGFSQVYRNIYRKKEVSLWGDFKEGMKKNWKQGLGACIVSLIVTPVLLLGMAYYSNNDSTVGTVISTLFVVVFFIFTAVQNFVYQEIVSIDLPLGKLYKNAWLFFLLKFGPCVGMSGAVIAALMLVPFALILSTSLFGYGLAVLWFLAIVIWFTQFMYAFATGEFINQYVAPGASSSSESEGEKDADGDDESDDDNDEDESVDDDDDDDDSEDDGDTEGDPEDDDDSDEDSDQEETSDDDIEEVKETADKENGGA